MPAEVVRDFRGRASAERWRCRISDALPGVRVDWLQEGPVSAQLKVRRLGESGFVESFDPPVQVSRPTQAGAPEDGYKLVVHLAGGGRYRYAGREFEQAAGDLVLLDTSRPFEVEHPGGAHVLVWGLSRDDIAPLLAAPEWGLHCHIPGGSGMGAVAAGFARVLAGQADRLEPGEQNELTTVLCTLVALALGPTRLAGDRGPAARRAVQRERIHAYIRTHLRNPRTTVESAAQDMAISRRWLHALLKEDGEGFSARLTRLRLEESLRILSDPAHDRVSITELALLVGFNDVSTFHRRFRRRFGMTPREARRARPETA